KESWGTGLKAGVIRVIVIRAGAIEAGVIRTNLNCEDSKLIVIICNICVICIEFPSRRGRTDGLHAFTLKFDIPC
ncbi:MAG: hypothetical protein WD022_09810, partial [Balneolaceae bacterium]